jgi:hypothetical protein
MKRLLFRTAIVGLILALMPLATARASSRAVDASPRRLDFGSWSISLGYGSTDQMVTYTNSSSVTVRPAAPYFTGDVADFESHPGPDPSCQNLLDGLLAPGASCNLSIAFFPQATGHRAAKFILPYDTGCADPSCQATVTIRVSGRGTP